MYLRLFFLIKTWLVNAQANLVQPGFVAKELSGNAFIDAKIS